jgi:protein phosphatase PTC6
MRALHGRSYKSRAYSKVLCPCLNDYPWRGPYHPSTSPCIPSPTRSASQHRRNFHDYFVTHLPSSSLHPDSRSLGGPGHKLPRSASTPHTQRAGSSPAAVPPNIGANRELTVVRIPLKSAKHHFGASVSRGTRPYNEDTYQAGTIEIPAFAKRAPVSLSRKGGAAPKENTSAEGASGDPQVFYFGVFDGHGGDECSKFLKEDLHTYIEGAVGEFELGSSLKKNPREKGHDAGSAGLERAGVSDIKLSFKGKESLDAVSTKTGDDVKGSLEVPSRNQEGILEMPDAGEAVQGEEPQAAPANKPKAAELEMSLINQWKSTVGGYFRRFKPDYFDLPSNRGSEPGKNAKAAPSQSISIETVLMYAFLRADLDFITAQASKPDPDSSSSSDLPLNNDEILGRPSHVAPSHRIGGPTRFKGGSTASVALISTPTPTPFWHPASPSTLVVAHVGDTRILLCATSTGLAVPITTNHHPSSPVEGTRLRRYAATFVTDSFGEERMSGLANTRSFGDMRSKRIGVSAEPELVRVELGPAEYSFLVLVSDGVSGTLSDQEIVDVVKEAKTPEQGSRDVVSFATEVSKEGDNTTCLVVRLGGWERRGEGGTGSLGTKEIRDWRRGDAADPRSRRT